MGAFEEAVKKKEDEMAEKKSSAIRDVASSARIASMKEQERQKALEKGAAMREQLKPGSMQPKTSMGYAKK